MAFVLIAITFFACRKDLEMDLLDADPNVEFRNDSDSTSVDSTNTVTWKSPNSAQFTMVYQDFMSKTSDIDLWWFNHHNGFFNWSESQILKSSDQGDFLLSVPTMKGDSITSLMHVWKDDSQFYYWHVTVDDLNKPVDSLVLNYGIENTILGLSSLIQHNRHIENDNSYPIVVKLFSSDLYDHLFTPGNIIPRGWCLISAPITLVEDLSDPIIMGMLIRELKRQGRLKKNNDEGGTRNGVGTRWTLDNQFQGNTPESTIRQAIEAGYFQNEPGTISGIIHGQTNHNNGTIEYYFWGWCPDEYDQAGDHSNWSTNTGGVTPPGSSGNTNPPPSPTPEEREEERWNTFNEQYNDPFSRTHFELEFERLFGDLGITFEEFIRMGGLSAFDVTYSGAGGDDTLIDGVVLDEEKALEIIFLNSEVLDSPKTPISDIKQALKDCFGENYVDCDNFSGSLSITLYVDQPTANSRASWDLYDDDGNLTVDVGHAFLGLNMENGGEATTLVTGLYPSGPVMPGDPKTGISLPAFGNDGGREFSVAITFEVTCEEFNQVLSSIASSSTPGPMLNNYYDLSTNNCSDFTMNHLNQIGLNIPDTRGTWPGGAGSNPGDLGEDLKDYNNPDATYNLDTDGGHAPQSNCL